MPKKPGVYITLDQYDRTLRKLERANLARHGTTPTLATISNRAGVVIEELSDPHLLYVVRDWRKRLREAAHIG